MIKKPRFRIFAGPNGAGKSSFYKVLREEKKIFTETFISAYRIEDHLRRGKGLHLATYKIKCTAEELKYHLLSNDRFIKLGDEEGKNITSALTISEDILNISDRKLINPSLASFIAVFMVEKLMESKQSFCYETVLDDADQLKYIELAKGFGYKTCLYYLFLDHAELYNLRIKSRIRLGGHAEEETGNESQVLETYANLPRALDLVDTAYLVNNSDKPQMVGTKTIDGIKIERNSIPKEISEFINTHHRRK